MPGEQMPGVARAARARRDSTVQDPEQRAVDRKRQPRALDRYEQSLSALHERKSDSSLDGGAPISDDALMQVLNEARQLRQVRLELQKMQRQQSRVENSAKAKREANAVANMEAQMQRSAVALLEMSDAAHQREEAAILARERRESLLRRKREEALEAEGVFLGRLTRRSSTRASGASTQAAAGPRRSRGSTVAHAGVQAVGQASETDAPTLLQMPKENNTQENGTENAQENAQEADASSAIKAEGNEPKGQGSWVKYHRIKMEKRRVAKEAELAAKTAADARQQRRRKAKVGFTPAMALEALQGWGLAAAGGREGGSRSIGAGLNRVARISQSSILAPLHGLLSSGEKGGGRKGGHYSSLEGVASRYSSSGDSSSSEKYVSARVPTSVRAFVPVRARARARACALRA